MSSMRSASSITCRKKRIVVLKMEGKKKSKERKRKMKLSKIGCTTINNLNRKKQTFMGKEKKEDKLENKVALQVERIYTQKMNSL